MITGTSAMTAAIGATAARLTHTAARGTCTTAATATTASIASTAWSGAGTAMARVALPVLTLNHSHSRYAVSAASGYAAGRQPMHPSAFAASPAQQYPQEMALAAQMMMQQQVQQQQAQQQQHHHQPFVQSSGYITLSVPCASMVATPTPPPASSFSPAHASQAVSAPMGAQQQHLQSFAASDGYQVPVMSAVPSVDAAYQQPVSLPMVMLVQGPGNVPVMMQVMPAQYAAEGIISPTAAGGAANFVSPLSAQQ